MLLVYVLLLTTGVALCCKEYSNTTEAWNFNDDFGLIVNGVQPRANSYPFLARLIITFNDELYGCGGALINSKYVLSAAHCILDDDGRRASEIQVILGAHNLHATEPNRIVVYGVGIVNSNYNRRTRAGDLSLIRLNQPVKYTNVISPICVPRRGSNYVNQRGTVAGWGSVGEDGPNSNVLLHIQIPILADRVCNKVFDGYDDDSMLCAGYTDGSKDTCQGDSGGPLFVQDGYGYTAVGIVSYGNSCAKRGYPSVYTEVQYFVNWIQRTASSGGSVCVV